VEAILYFLGEVVRRHLSPDIPGMTPRVIQIKIGPASQPMPESDCGGSDDGISKPLPGNYHCESLFFVERGGNGSADLAVAYHNDIYWLHDERPKTGWSLPTLSLVRELLALNTWAKELPATTTLSIVAP
jgi:hypothetical protein